MRKKFCIQRLVVCLCVTAIATEATTRVYHLARWGMSIIDGETDSAIAADAELGWKAKENYRFIGARFKSDGTEYKISLSQDRNGFRTFGDVGSGKPKVLVIGDSDTHALEASDDRTFYAMIKAWLDVEIFAYGVSGYGNLQQLKVLERFYDLVKPDLILWQLSVDDLNDNVPELDEGTPDIGRKRPYWIDGKVNYTYHNPQPRHAGLGYCRLCGAIERAWRRLLPQADFAKTTLLRETRELNVLKSIQTTDRIMAMVKKKAGSVPIFAFVTGAADSEEGAKYEKVIAEMSRNHDILLLDGVEKDVTTAAQDGLVTKAADHVHLNEAGHRILGETLVRFLTPHVLSSSDR